MKSLIVSLVLLAVVLPLTADTGGANIVIPIAGRTAGAFGTEWYTDLVITNLRPTATAVHVTFYPADGQYAFTSLPLPGYGTIELEDVVSTTLGKSGLGMLRVHSASPDTRITARAYIYNRGSAGGEYGQYVPGVSIEVLEREHVLTGIVGSEGRRTNVGFANPWPIEAPLLVHLVGSEGQLLNTLYPRVGPQQVLQINDIFSAAGVAPAETVSIRVFSTGPYVYPYASIVRSDTGDAILVPGTGIALGRQNVIQARCTEPAALLFADPGTSAGNWIAIFDRDRISPAGVQALAAQHGFVIQTFYEEAFLGFAAELTPSQIAAIRCEPSALALQENAIQPIP